MRLIVYEHIDCYEVPQNMAKTKIAYQLESEFRPFLKVDFCTTFDRSYYELRLKDQTFKLDADSPIDNYRKLRSLIKPHIPKDNDNIYEIQVEMLRDNKPFVCPALKYPKQKKPLLNEYSLLYSGSYKQDLDNSIRREGTKLVCDRNFGKNTDLYNLCVHEETLERFSDNKSYNSFKIGLIVLLAIAVLIGFLRYAIKM